MSASPNWKPVGCVIAALAAAYGLFTWTTRGVVKEVNQSLSDPPTCRLVGHVWDGETAVEGAMISIVRCGPGSAHGSHHDGGDVITTLQPRPYIDESDPRASEGSPSIPVSWFETDLNGSFDVFATAAGDADLLTILPGGGEANPVHVMLSFDSDCEAEVRASGPHVSGRVVERTTGSPLAKAEVRLTYLPGRRPLRTDEEGRFALACVPGDNHQLDVRHTGHVARLAEVVAAAPETDVTGLVVELDPEAVIEGVLLDGTGQRLLEPRGVLVFFDDHAPQPSGEEMLYAETKGGEFRVGGVAAGRVRIGVLPPLHGDLSWKLENFLPSIRFDQVVDVAVGQTVEITLQESVPISLPTSPKH